MGYARSIRIIPENCRGCRRCQVACSSYDPGPLNPRLAGIQILQLEDEGGRLSRHKHGMPGEVLRKGPSGEYGTEAGMRGRVSLRGPGDD